jgi:hypothetical protein
MDRYSIQQSDNTDRMRVWMDRGRGRIHHWHFKINLAIEFLDLREKPII